VPDNLPPPVAPPPGGPRRRRRWWHPVVAVAGALIGLVLLAAVVPVERYALAPGDVAPVEPRVNVDDSVTTYDSDGEVLFVTVKLPRLSLLGWLVAALDPDVEVKTREELFGDQTREENREQNLKRMGYSKELASYVALSRLGYDVVVEGGGPVIGSLCLEVAADGTSCARAAPADEELDPGDAIVELDGQPIHLLDDLAAVLAERAPGDVIPVTYVRGGDRVEAEITLTEADDGRTIVGFLPTDTFIEDVAFQLPFGVEIDSGEVGGPSAGLAFTLTLLDLLTPGSLTGDLQVAATGEILVDGRVGPIGGLHQKTTAVGETDADVFLVPADQVDQALAEAAGTDLRVVPVRTLDEALDVLKDLGGDVSGIPDLEAA
jgi:PDZ domain-containing protein